MTERRDEYTHGHHESVVRTHAQRTVENSAQYLVPHLRDGLDILDVGCGPGSISIDLAQRVGAGHVLGIDASDEILVSARERARAAGVANVSFERGDAYALDAPDNSVDIVHSHQVLQHLARPVDALIEFHRVLRPGGIIAVRDVDYGGVMWHPASPGLQKWLDTYDAVHVWNGGEANAGRALRAWSLEAGFTDVTLSASMWVFASDAERVWWGDAWAERATKSQFAVHALESGIATSEDLEEIAQAWRDWVACQSASFLMPHGEVIARKS